MSAEVFKIEPPGGDATRSYTPPDIGGESPAFLSMNRNKLGVVLDLSKEEGRRIAREIAVPSDVLLDYDAACIAELASKLASTAWVWLHNPGREVLDAKGVIVASGYAGA